MGIITPMQTDTNGNVVQTGSLKELGKDDFLQLLVTKMTHQDPLEPQTDEAMISDLAQFSSLEQMSNMNKLLEQSLNYDYLQMQTINNTMATSLIGKEVNASYESVYLDEDNLPHVNFTNTEFVKDVTIKIYDEDGALVRTMTDENFGIGEHSLRWDGRDNNGNRLPQGFYDVEITGTNTDGDDVEVSQYVVGRVEGVTYYDGAAYLRVNGLEIPLSMVNEINLYNESTDTGSDETAETDETVEDDGVDEG